MEATKRARQSRPPQHKAKSKSIIRLYSVTESSKRITSTASSQIASDKNFSINLSKRKLSGHSSSLGERVPTLKLHDTRPPQYPLLSGTLAISKVLGISTRRIKRFTMNKLKMREFVKKYREFNIPRKHKLQLACEKLIVYCKPNIEQKGLWKWRIKVRLVKRCERAQLVLFLLKRRTSQLYRNAFRKWGLFLGITLRKQDVLRKAVVKLAMLEGTRSQQLALWKWHSKTSGAGNSFQCIMKQKHSHSEKIAKQDSLFVESTLTLDKTEELPLKWKENSKQGTKIIRRRKLKPRLVKLVFPCVAKPITHPIHIGNSIVEEKSLLNNDSRSGNGENYREFALNLHEPDDEQLLLIEALNLSITEPDGPITVSSYRIFYPIHLAPEMLIDQFQANTDIVQRENSSGSRTKTRTTRNRSEIPLEPQHRSSHIKTASYCPVSSI